MTIKKHAWFKKRGYLHFDAPVGFKTAQRLTNSPVRVAKHAFLPLINYDISNFKVYVDDDGTVQKEPKSRPISYASHIDSHIYAYYAWQLSKLYEKNIQSHSLNDNVLAFRSLGKSNIQFANQAFEDIKSRKNCSVVALDVKGFFDNLDHKILKDSWGHLIEKYNLPADHFNVYKSLTKYSKVNKSLLYKEFNIPISNPKNGRFKICDIKEFRDVVRKKNYIVRNDAGKGIPQGSPISALLSNIYMFAFDIAAKAKMSEQGGSYYRYCDDILFITQREFRDDIESFAQDEIKKLILEIQPSKTEKRDFWISKGQQVCDKPLQYLGFTFDGQRKLLRSAALARFSNRMKSGVRLAKKTRVKKNRIKVDKGLPRTGLYKRKLLQQYSHLGGRNFIRYGHRAADIMESNAIRKQLKPLWNRLQDEINK
jgi:RNA-directed DNA polymerase